jgi:hypothetical protein
MVGLAWRLLAIWRDALAAHEAVLPDRVPVPSLLAVTDTDVIEAHTRVTEAGGPRPSRASSAAVGAPPAAATVRLRLTPGSEPHGPGSVLAIDRPAPGTEVRAPDGEHVDESRDTAARDFLADACTVLFGQSATAPRPVADPDLERAIAAARAGLGAIRDRYAAGLFAPAQAGRGLPRQRLLVRYALTADEAIEYPWAYVTSWRDPFRILATSAGDSVHLPRLRAGRPVVLDAAAVVDWAVELDGVGIVEGAFTRSAS